VNGTLVQKKLLLKCEEPRAQVNNILQKSHQSHFHSDKKLMDFQQSVKKTYIYKFVTFTYKHSEILRILNG